TASAAIYTLSLHDALPIFGGFVLGCAGCRRGRGSARVLCGLIVLGIGLIAPNLARASTLNFVRGPVDYTVRGWSPEDGLPSSNRSEEHTSELQSRENLVCR